jgi:exosortase
MGPAAQIAEAAPASLSKSGWKAGWWWQAVVVLVLVGWLYSSILGRLANQWWHDPNFSHGFFVPAFSLFVLWQERSRLSALPLKPSWWGLPIVALALCILILGNLGAELFLSRASLLLLIAGLAIIFLGWQYIRAALFPWAFLILMIPIPSIIFNQITFPLQLLASKVASNLLPLAGVPVLREGNVIGLPLMQLEVAEACSGIRSLLSLATLSIIYGYLMESRIWIRVLIALASVPIAVGANSLRIVGTGLLVQYWDPEKAEGFFHLFSGWLIFVISLAMLFVVHKLLRAMLKGPAQS